MSKQNCTNFNEHQLIWRVPGKRSRYTNPEGNSRFEVQTEIVLMVITLDIVAFRQWEYDIRLTSVLFGSFEVTTCTRYETKALQQYKWRENVGTVDISLADVSIIQELDNPGVIE